MTEEVLNKIEEKLNYYAECINEHLTMVKKTKDYKKTFHLSMNSYYDGKIDGIIITLHMLGIKVRITDDCKYKIIKGEKETRK